MKISRITKVAGASLAGFVAVALVADRTNAGQAASQVAGFVGAFVGSLVASRRPRNDSAEAAGELEKAEEKADGG